MVTKRISEAVGWLSEGDGWLSEGDGAWLIKRGRRMAIRGDGWLREGDTVNWWRIERDGRPVEGDDTVGWLKE